MQTTKKILFYCILLAGTCSYVMAQEIDHWETVIAPGQTASYLVPTEELPAGWASRTFDDSGWPTAIAGIGYGDDDDNTVIVNILSVYMRLRFQVTDITAIEKLLLDMDFDDGFVAYLNGYEIARYNLGSSFEPTTFDQTPDVDVEANLHRGLNPYRFTIADKFIDSLVTGENIFAVEVHNWSSTSSDLSSNPYLHAGINSATQYFNATPGWFIAPVAGSGSLPIMMINTSGQTIINNQRIAAGMSLIHDPADTINYTYDTPNVYDGRISIEIRGASSSSFPKKSYNIETQTDSGTNNNVPLLGMPRENDWVLYAPYSDKSMVRNVISYRWYEQLGYWSPRTRFIDLYLNDEYQGIYVLTEKIKQDDDRVDLPELTSFDTSDDAISGGYILQVDRTDNLAWNEYWTTPVLPPYSGFPRNTFEYYDPKIDQLTGQQAAFIKDWMNDLDALLASDDYMDPVTGYRKYIDVGSFVDYFIFHELNKDVDAYRLSAFFYKLRNSEGGKLVAGPPWDYNLTYGNVDYGGDVRETTGWIYNRSVSMYWWRRLMADPWFSNQVVCRWQELSGSIASEEYMFGLIDSSINVMGASVDTNFERWPILGVYVWPNNIVFDTFEEEVAFLKTWISERISFLTASWDDECMEISSDDLSAFERPGELRFFPNPSKLPSVNMIIPVLFEGNYRMDIFTLQGEMVRTSQGFAPAMAQLTLDGLDGLEPGIYVVRLSGEGSQVLVGKLIRE